MAAQGRGRVPLLASVRILEFRMSIASSCLAITLDLKRPPTSLYVYAHRKPSSGEEDKGDTRRLPCHSIGAVPHGEPHESN